MNQKRIDTLAVQGACGRKFFAGGKLEIHKSHPMIKRFLLSLARSETFKRFLCDAVDSYVRYSDNSVDDSLARGLRAALLPRG